jgi:hypothetical protein
MFLPVASADAKKLVVLLLHEVKMLKKTPFLSKDNYSLYDVIHNCISK